MSRNQTDLKSTEQETLYESLQQILSTFNNDELVDHNSQELLSEWFFSNPISQNYLERNILPFIPDHLEAAIIRTWIAQDENNTTITNFLRILPDLEVADEDAGNDTDLSYTENEESDDEIEETYAYLSSVEALFEWIRKAQNDPSLAILSEQVFSRLRSNDVVRLIKIWLNKTTHNPTIVQLLETIPTYDNLIHEEGSILISAWLKKDGNTMSFQDLASNIFPRLAHRDYYTNILNRWFKKNAMTFEDLTQNLALLSENDDVSIDEFRSSLFGIWLSQDNSECNFRKFTDQISPLFEDEKEYKGAISSWIINASSDELNAANFQEILLSLIQSSKSWDEVASQWINQLSSDQKAPYILYAINASGNLFNFANINSFLKKIHDVANYIPYLCRNLYFHDDDLRANFLMNCLDEEILKSSDTNSLHQSLPLIANDDSASAILTKAFNLFLKPKDFVAITNNRFVTRYKIVTSILRRYSLEDIISSESYAHFRRIFQHPNLTITELLAALDINNHISDFLILTSADFKSAMHSITSPENQGYLSQQEYLKLRALSEERVTYPQIKLLCDYLGTKISPAPDLSDDSYRENYHINFSKYSGMQDEAAQEAASTFFKTLLSLPATAIVEMKDEIINFCNFITGQSDLATTLSDINKTKLCQFFSESKARLAQLLSQQGGIDQLSSCISTLTDGCSANIATQMTLALHQLTISDAADREFYIYFNEQIFTKIVNNDTSDLINIHSDPLENQAMQNYFASPNGILKGLTLQVSERSDFLLAALDRENLEIAYKKRELLYDFLAESHAEWTTEEVHKKACEIAAALALSIAMPSIIAHPDLADTMTEHAHYLHEIQQQLIKINSQPKHSLSEDEDEETGVAKKARGGSESPKLPESPSEEIKNPQEAALDDTAAYRNL